MIFVPALLSLSVAQESLTIRNACPPETGSPFILVDSFISDPYIRYSKYYLELPGTRRVIDDTVVTKETVNPMGGTYKWNPVYYEEIVGQRIDIETWSNKQDPTVIDFEFVITVRNWNESPWTYKSLSLTLRDMVCPLPNTEVRGNIYWNWTSGAEWYEQNVSSDEQMEYYEVNRLFDSFERRWLQPTETEIYYEGRRKKQRDIPSGGNLFFNCREVVAPIYDGSQEMPPLVDPMIEWDGNLWRSMFPEEENALIPLGEVVSSAEEDKNSGFAIHVRFSLGGAKPMMLNNAGEKIPPLEVEWLPNVLVLHGHAKFKMINPIYPEEGCPPPDTMPMDEEPDYSSDEIVLQ